MILRKQTFLDDLGIFGGKSLIWETAAFNNWLFIRDKMFPSKTEGE
jgi:hypothetical protein